MYCKIMFFFSDTALALDNSLRFRHNLQKPIMTIEDKIRDEKLQYDINKEAAKVSVIIIS